MNEAIVIAILAAVGGGAVAALIGGIFQRPKTKAEVGKLVAEEGRTIDQRWKEWADELEGKLGAEREEHRKQTAEHRAEMTTLGERLETVERKLTESRTRSEELEQELNEARKEIDKLRRQVVYERDVTRSIVGWAFAMRDELRHMGGQVPDAPVKVQDFINGIDEPLYIKDHNPDVLD